MYGNSLRELYDLEGDPQEEHNVVEERPEIAGAMEEELEGWINARLQELGRDIDPVRKHGVSLKGTFIGGNHERK